jgi:aminopeptidase N
MITMLGIPWMGLIAAQTVGPEVRPPHEYDLQNVKFDVTVNFQKESLSGTVENTVLTKKANANLFFDLGAQKIEKVEVLPKQAFKTQITGKNLIVKLAKSPVGQVVTVKIKYSVEPEAGLFFVPQSRAYPALTDVAYTQGEMEDNRYWLPTYDFPDDKATTEGIFRVPKGFSVLSNGKLVQKKESATEGIWHWKMEKPMSTYLISFVAGRYTAIPDGTFKGKPIEIWTPTGLEEWGKASFGGTDKIVALYSKLTGVDYPWAKYAQSFVPEFMFGGMENTSCTTQTIGALTPPNARPSETDDGLNAHELAHQWFGDLITAKSWFHIWVNEGWATFLPHFWTRNKLGEDAYHISRYNTYQGAFFGAQSEPMIRDTYSVPMDLFDGNAYPGGATRMFMLMRQLGEENFWKATKRYLEKYSYQNVDTNDFFKYWSSVTGKDLEQFKKQWFYQKGTPNVSIKKVENGYQVVQKTDGFTIDLEYNLINEERVFASSSVKLEPNVPKVISAKSSETICLDPGSWILGTIPVSFEPTDEQVKLLWKQAPNAATKMRIIRSPRISTSLRKELYAMESSSAVKVQLISSIQDADFILDLTESSDKSIAFAAVSQSIAARNSKTAARMRQIFDTTSDESLKETAYESLIRAKSDAETAELGWNTTTYSLGTKTAALNWYATNDKDKARKMALDAVRNFAPGPVRMSAISVLGRVKDEPGKREVFDLLVQLAKGRAYAPMDAAINALASYGDKAAIPVIESRRNHQLHFGRGTVESALARLNR